MSSQEQLLRLLRRLIRLQMERRMYQEVKKTIPEIPDDIFKEMYFEIIRPVLIKVAKEVNTVVKPRR